MNKQFFFTKTKLFLIFATGFLSSIFCTEFLLKSQYIYFKEEFKNNLHLLKLKSNKSSISECPNNEIDYIPNKATVIIGHAYGSHKGSEERNHVGISPKIEKFLTENKLKLDTVIFSGDVFSKPSKKKWANLFSKYGNYFDIYIAPGNHDVGIVYDTAQRDIFNEMLKRIQPLEKPFLITKGGFNIIIDDSNLSGNFLRRIKNIIKEKSLKKNLIIVRHHVPISELAYATNFMRKKDLTDLDNFQKTFSKFKNTTFIYGDGGAYSSLPRIACYRKDNILHIVNGIGENPEDRIIVINKGLLKIYKIAI
tara:strand:+ start:1830 stop:2753 length:924 start_codon:yes stop_codon:yes gene_type:complete